MGRWGDGDGAPPELRFEGLGLMGGGTLSTPDPVRVSGAGCVGGLEGGGTPGAAGAGIGGVCPGNGGGRDDTGTAALLPPPPPPPPPLPSPGGRDSGDFASLPPTAAPGPAPPGGRGSGMLGGAGEDERTGVGEEAGDTTVAPAPAAVACSSLPPIVADGFGLNAVAGVWPPLSPLIMSGCAASGSGMAARPPRRPGGSDMVAERACPIELASLVTEAATCAALAAATES